MAKKILVAYPHGFCVGVTRAVRTAGIACRRFPRPVYCLHEIVHNSMVGDSLTDQGMVFIDDLEKVPDGSTILFSAHGVSPAVRERAQEKALNIVDATCPYVLKVHREVKRFAENGYTVFLIGHRTHQEVVGVAGEAPDKVVVLENEEEARTVQVPDPNRVAAVTQTTLSVVQTDTVRNALLSRFPALVEPARKDICYATENRQSAVRMLAERADFVLVLGSPNSSNTRRLVEVAVSSRCSAKLINGLNELSQISLDAIQALGLTSGASTPEKFLRDVVKALGEQGFTDVERLVAVEESVKDFRLPIADD